MHIIVCSHAALYFFNESIFAKYIELKTQDL